MEFIRTEGTKDLETALISALDSALTDNNSVLWLVPGGSNIAVAVRVMAALDSHNLQNLTVALTDERFGPIGHVDSNYLQLHSQGFLERGALFIDLLHGASFEETVVTAAAAMKHAFENSEIIIGFF
jgi:6-phosphogluconolactonase/glucosamine-6-phosphate isomerase/deaminase